MRCAALALLMLAAAQPALASRNLEGLLVNTFIQRCVTPMQAGNLPDVAGLTAPEGSPAMGAPGSDIRYSDVDGPMGLAVATQPDGLTTCAMGLELPEGFDLAQVKGALTDQLAGAGFRALPTCDNARLKPLFGFEGPATAEGRGLGVLGFKIEWEGPQPDRLALIASEPDRSLPPDTNCATPPRGQQ